MSACADAINDAVLQVEQDGAWDVVFVVCLVEEDILAVACNDSTKETLACITRLCFSSFRCVDARNTCLDLDVVTDESVLCDAVLQAQLLPEFIADCHQNTQTDQHTRVYVATRRCGQRAVGCRCEEAGARARGRRQRQAGKCGKVRRACDRCTLAPAI